MNAIEYAQKVSDLFAVPTTAMRVKKLIDGDLADAKNIAGIINQDSGLAAHLLKVANSAIYRFPRKIDTIQKAIQVIGTTAAYDYALIFGISNAFSSGQDQLIDLDKFWEQSVTCAILAKHFSEVFGCRDADRIFTSGLLHNIGELVVMRVSPHLASDCNRFDKAKIPRDCQFEVLGFTFAEVSASLSQQWMLPDSIVSTIAMQHHDDTFADSIDVQIIQLAYELSIINTYPTLFNLKTHLEPFLYQGLTLEMKDVEESLDAANFQVEQILHLFNPDVFKAA